MKTPVHLPIPQLAINVVTVRHSSPQFAEALVLPLGLLQGGLAVREGRKTAKKTLSAIPKPSSVPISLGRMPNSSRIVNVYICIGHTAPDNTDPALAGCTVTPCYRRLRQLREKVGGRDLEGKPANGRAGKLRSQDTRQTNAPAMRHLTHSIHVL